jgi:hypothetical protein
VPPLAAALNDPAADIATTPPLPWPAFGDTRAIGVVREMLDRTRLDKVERMRPDQKEATMLAAIDPDQKREMPLNLAIILSLWHRNITVDAGGIAEVPRRAREAEDHHGGLTVSRRGFVVPRSSEFLSTAESCRRDTAELRRTRLHAHLRWRGNRPLRDRVEWRAVDMRLSAVLRKKHRGRCCAQGYTVSDAMLDRSSSARHSSRWRDGFVAYVVHRHPIEPEGSEGPGASHLHAICLQVEDCRRRAWEITGSFRRTPKVAKSLALL